ncbi:MAG TPA: shikimate dehydrogenase [Hyphomicrobiaceae bacterium]|nr:shikimate dehydrogenase [Hyphomicrobiaceae bacterium]
MKRACVVGWPVEHSRSPLIHGYWLAKYGIDGSYGKVAVPPDQAGTFLRSLPAQGLVGCNVTLPHKEIAFAVADEKRPAAAAVGAANTLWLEGGRLVADNTDGYGFIHNLRATIPGVDVAGAVVVVLGAGGAARAVVHALLAHGVAEVRIVNRTQPRAETLAQHFGSKVKAYAWQERTMCASGAGLLVNTTTLGMSGAPPLDLDVAALNPGSIVADIVYVPLVTPLLAAARARNLATVDGLGMLLHQAVPGFEKWFGVRPEVTQELRALLERDIAGR